MPPVCMREAALVAAASEQRAATDIFKKLSEELDLIMGNDSTEVKDGLRKVVLFLHSCFASNAAVLDEIKQKLVKNFELVFEVVSVKLR